MDRLGQVSAVAAVMLGTGLVIAGTQTAVLGGAEHRTPPPAVAVTETPTQTVTPSPSTTPAESKIRWRTALGSGTAMGTTPTVVGGLVVLGSVDGTLYANHEDNGEVAWAVKVTETGPPGGPAVAGETLLVTVPNTLLALDVRTGSPRWASPIAGVASAATVAGDLVYVASGRLQAFDLSTGKQRWTADIGVGTLTSTPAVDAATGLVITGSADGTLYAVDAASGETRWTRRIEGRIDAPVQITDNLVLTAGADGALTGLDLAAGEVVWTQRLSNAAGGFHTAIAADGTTAYAQASNGILYAVDIATGRSQWETLTNGGHSAPLLTGETLHVAGANTTGQGEVQTIDVRTGEIRERLSIGEHVKANLAATDLTLYVPGITKLLSVTTS